MDLRLLSSRLLPLPPSITRLPSRLFAFPSRSISSPFPLRPSIPRIRFPPSASGRVRLNPACSSHAEESQLPDSGGIAGSSTLSGEELDSGPPSIWAQMKEIVLFAAPATGLWICGPLMSLIDTMVIGQGSSLELAALGPGTVFCDYLCYVFMFLSIATSNMVATSLAKKDKGLAQHQISMLLFAAFACGLGMFLFTRLLGPQVLAAFTGSENMHIVPSANTYIQIRGFAWPAVLVGMVAQSASLGMKDSWGPLKALAAASAINGFGDILLCFVFGFGIAGAAWATMLSQVVAAFMMMNTLNKTSFGAFSLSVPSPGELLQIFEIAAPVFITMTSKVAFYSLLTYFATSMGTMTIAAHQVMINVFCMCTVWGEPLSQTAQSFMPELIHGVNRSLVKARMLLRSLIIIGAMTGLTLGVVGTSFPWLFPYLFTTDHTVIGEAGRDLRFLSLSMTGCFCFGGLTLLLVCSRGFGLPGCWWALAGFQWARFSLAFQRLISPHGMLYGDDFYQHELVKVKTT
ncbi:protein DETOXIFICATION 46, chloroplastic isoform X2 [Phoenix dactylifera]|uniref:Protein DETOXIFICATION n=1 Tax=Phoenix dactylifera TaxID=42345 RepID=A0A8B8ZLI3_PHODC|nr:protein DETOXIFICATION 46, chloroplastic isoform X2 [Phoenix dactylifera]